jgi:membrane-associated phospholipid phosphatase
MRLFFLLIFFLCFETHAELSPFTDFGKNAKESFTENIPFHVAAVVLTPALIYSGADAKVHTALKGGNNDYLYKPTELVGYMAPFIFPIPAYIAGKLLKSERTQGLGFALFQSTIITFSTISFLKAFTGRPPPDVESDRSIQRQARDYNFGLLRRGIFDGWPSGHMATISSVMGTFMSYYAEENWLQYFGWGTMGYALISVSALNQGQFHWFSDGVAGGLMGYSIGSTVGRNMRARVKGLSIEEKKEMTLAPLFSPAGSGVQLVYIY